MNQNNEQNELSRRKFFLAAAASTAVCGGALFLWHYFTSPTPLTYEFPEEPVGEGGVLTPTPARHRVDETREETEGPFYTPNTPQRNVLRETGMKGTPFLLTGRVLDIYSQPIPGAVIDFWQADANGIYDNEGFRLRGHQFTDANGTYRLETIKPAPYEEDGLLRTPHLHVKAQGRKTFLLTTQIFFPNEEKLNKQDLFFHEELLMRVNELEDGSLEGTFDFVLEV